MSNLLHCAYCKFGDNEIYCWYSLDYSTHKYKNQKSSNLLVILDSLRSNRSITHANNVNCIRALKFTLDSSFPEVISYLFRSTILITKSTLYFQQACITSHES